MSLAKQPADVSVKGKGRRTMRTVHFAVRSTVVVACAALVLGSITTGAQASVLPTSVQPATALPAQKSTIDIPTPDDIAAAKSSEAGTAAEVTKIEALLDAANAKLKASIGDSSRANDAYTSALTTLADRQSAAATAKAKAAEAQAASDKAKKQVGQLAGDLYKNAGMTPGVQSILTGATNADSLYEASTLNALGESRNTILANAQSAAGSAKSLKDQADAAQRAADDASRTANDAKSAAQGAVDAQNQAVAQTASDKSTLIDQLATLHNTTVALETQRVNGLEAQKQQAALAAVMAAATAKAAADQQAASQAAAAQAAQQLPAAQTQAVVPVQAAPAQPAAPVAYTPPAAPQAPPVNNPAPPSSGGGSVVGFALSKVGSPYSWGGTGPGYDCSGLVWKAYASVGINLPRGGSDQFNAAPIHVPLSQAQPGDLVMFNSAGPNYWTHIAIYIGNDQIVQALNPTDGVSVNTIASMWVPPYGIVARY